MKNLLTRWIASALALFIIAQLNVGIQLNDHGPQTVETLLLVVLALGLVNALIRPIIMFFAWPINCSGSLAILCRGSTSQDRFPP